MRYELFIRGAAAFDEELLGLAQEQVAAQGPALRCEPYQVDGVIRGIDVVADLDQPGAGGLLCRATFAIAAARGLTVFDPQLGRPVMEGDAEQIEAETARASAFGEAAPVSPASTAGKLNPSTRLWVAIAGLLVLALLLARGLTCLGS